jgi:PDZ domain-containing secreted protein
LNLPVNKQYTAQRVIKVIDDDEDLTGEFTFTTITCPYIAADLARMIYDKSRAQRTISFVGTQELMDVEPGDIIRITEDILDLSNKHLEWLI